VCTLLVLLTAFASPTPALAATTCTSTFAGVTIQGNLTVPDGFRCLLIDSTVTGNVTLGQSATFESYGTTIAGNLRGDGALTVSLEAGTVVKGNVTVSGTIDLLFIGGIRVNGDVTLTGNATPSTINIRESTIGGNLTFSGNTSNFGAPFIQDNTIGGNLRCEGNAPSPTVGGNVVSGNQRGQCAAL
jgi:hypothetical protein